MQPGEPVLGIGAKYTKNLGGCADDFLKSYQHVEYATQERRICYASREYATQAENMLRKKRQVTFSLDDCRANIGKVVKNMLRKISS